MRYRRICSEHTLSRTVFSALILMVSICSGSALAESDFQPQPQPQPQSQPQTASLVPMTLSGAGGFEIAVEINGVEEEFLLDTGASLVTINQDTFRKIKSSQSVTKTRSVGARLANGKVKVLDVYIAEHFRIGDSCQLGNIEFAVVENGGRNLLGMNVLSQVAPFTISMSPPELSVAQCMI